MLREITKPIGRYKVGEFHDYPLSVWDKIAKDAGQKLDSFSTVASHNPSLHSPLKGRLHVRTKLGTTTRQ